MLKKTILSAALAASFVALGLAASGAAHAAPSGQTTFTVKVPAVTILDYYQSIQLNIDANAMETLAGAGGAQTPSGAITATSGSGSSLTADAAIKASGSGNLSAVNLTINNAWAVRSITSAGGGLTTVTVAFQNGSTSTLNGVTDNTASIGLSGIGTDYTAQAGKGLAAGDAVPGDITMTMDLSNAKSADTYQGTGGNGVIVITATST